MKALPFEIPKPTESSLIYQVDKAHVFYDQLHQHQEIQLSYIKTGEGTLVVGDSISQYQQGDILVIGPNLPHVFKSEERSETPSEMITLFFSKTGFGTHFFDLEELQEVLPFFKRVDNGFKVLSHKALLHGYFGELHTSSTIERFIVLLKILKTMSLAKKVELSSYVYEKKYSADEGKRMQDIMSFTIHQYPQSISLDQIAHVASMTKNAFCKYFKKRTNKTYVQFLNEVRVENACKLLISKKEVSIAAIAYQCGFNNVANFNRQFKWVKKVTPSHYRRLS